MKSGETLVFRDGSSDTRATCVSKLIERSFFRPVNQIGRRMHSLTLGLIRYSRGCWWMVRVKLLLRRCVASVQGPAGHEFNLQAR